VRGVCRAAARILRGRMRAAALVALPLVAAFSSAYLLVPTVVVAAVGLRASRRTVIVDP
jgi:hypothetical protein